MSDTIMRKDKCYICLSISNNDTLDTINNMYYTDCRCNQYIHKRCIERYYQYNGSKICPICRKKVYNKNHLYLKYFLKYHRTICVSAFIVFIYFYTCILIYLCEYLDIDCNNHNILNYDNIY